MLTQNIVKLNRFPSRTCGCGFPSQRVQYYGTKSNIVLAHNIYYPIHAEDGPPFFITHGLLGSKGNWNSIAKATARNVSRRVVTFDARNHGDSPHSNDFSYEIMADDILSLAKHLEIDKFSLLGHSMGGRTAMTFALKYPEFLERLIVVDVSPIELNADFPSMRVYVQGLRELQLKFEGSELPLSQIRKTCDNALKAIVIDPVVRAFLLTNVAADKEGKIHWKPNLQVLLDKFDEIGKFPVNLLKNQCEQPTLFIRGQKSLYIPLADFPKIQKVFTNARLTTVENAGHWPHAENTVRFMEIMLPFVNGSLF